MIHIINENIIKFSIKIESEEEARLMRNILFNAKIRLVEIDREAADKLICHAAGPADVYNIEKGISTCTDLITVISKILG